MYSKIALLLLSVVLVSAENNCDCSDANLEQSLKESNDIVQFLIKVSENSVTDDEKYPAVPPGVVTGALGCQCSENLRRKRNIMPKNEIPLDRSSYFLGLSRTNWDLLPSKRISNRNCPVGYLRVGRTCIHAHDMLY